MSFILNNSQKISKNIRICEGIFFFYKLEQNQGYS